MEEIKLEDNIEKLKYEYKMSEELINKLLYNPNNSTSSYDPIEISTLLARIDDGDETQRVCIVIENLHTYLGISYETLASFGNISTEELERFLQDPKSLTEKKKFILAVRMMFIHFVLKEKYFLDINT